MSPKMGQKLTDNPKDKLIQIRMSKETIEKLDCLVAEQKSDMSKIIREGIEIQYKEIIEKRLLKGGKVMLLNLKSIANEIKENICDTNVSIKYHKESEDVFISNSIVSFECVSGEERKSYEKLTEEDKKDFVSNSAHINLLLISVERLYELYHMGISCDYEMTINMIKKVVPVSADNEKILFAIFVILHEFGHWHDFESKDKKPYLYAQDEKELKEAYDLKMEILNNESLQEKSDYKIKEQLRKWFNRFNAVPREKRANEYAISKIKDAYNFFKKRGYIV